MELDVATEPVIGIGVPFALRLADHGDRLAVVTADGAQLSYRELAARVAEDTRRLGTGRKLVLIAARNELDPLVTYLAALAAGHPVMLVPDDDRGHLDELVARYDPDVLLRPTGGVWRLRVRRERPAHELHPELALLLSTSGSTGSPKLVRLSGVNVQSNAEAIASYLDIRHTDRAVASLPMSYCYGLSVINSNVLRGAAVLLTGDSVLDEQFWSMARTHRATSLHGVPYTFDLLDRIGLDRLDLPSLRYVTQAGGRLEPQRVSRYAELADQQGWWFVVMYGQTEATARMAYLPPELATRHPDTVGIAIPGGEFEIADPDETGEGKLVYRGPNVMLGYAETPADLALGRTIDELHTGDIARRTPEGLYQLVGRQGRFAKLFGLRIDLQELESRLRGDGHEAVCLSDDRALIIAVTGGAAPGVIRARASAHTGLPPSAIDVRPFAELPRLPSGKIDYPAIAQCLAAGTAATEGPGSVRDLFARVLGPPGVTDDDTFVGLGGDSLTYVQTSIQLEKMLGSVPPQWPTMPVRDLERLRPQHARFPAVETNVVLRAIAISLVVATHVGLFTILGGAHVLLIIAGWSFARFGLADVDGSTGLRILRSGTRIAVPAMAWLALRTAFADDVGVANVLLVNNYLQAHPAIGYWFIEVLVQVLFVLAVLSAIPAVQRAERRYGFAAAFTALGVALLIHWALTDRAADFPEHAMSTHGAAWFFVLGWAAQRARSPWQKVVVLGVAAAMLPGYFGQPLREAVVLGGLAIVLTMATIRVPRAMVRWIGLVASASLYIYLTHYAVFPPLLGIGVPAVLAVVASLGVGIGVWVLVERGGHTIRALWRAHGRVSAPARRPNHRGRGHVGP